MDILRPPESFVTRAAPQESILDRTLLVRQARFRALGEPVRRPLMQTVRNPQ
jgi:hypothetical protein